MALVETFKSFVANKDTDNEIVMLCIPYFFNPSLFYHKKSGNKTPLSGYYDYNVYQTHFIIGLFDEICEGLLKITDGFYDITFSCDSNTLYFTFRVIMSPCNSPRMCAKVFKFLSELQVMANGLPQIIFYDDYYRKLKDLGEIKYLIKTKPVDSRLMNLTAGRIAEYETVGNAPIIFKCDRYPEIYCKELAAQHNINSFVGGRDHLLIDHSDKAKVGKIDIEAFRADVDAQIEELIASKDIFKYIKYGMPISDLKIVTSINITEENFESSDSTAANAGSHNASETDTAAADNADALETEEKLGGRSVVSYIDYRDNIHFGGRESCGGDGGLMFGGKYAKNYRQRDVKSPTQPKAPVRQSAYNPCDTTQNPADKEQGDKTSLANKETPLLQYIDPTGLYRRTDVPVNPQVVDYTPNPATLGVFLSYIGLSQADYDELDESSRFALMKKFIKANPHMRQVFSNDGKYTLYKSPGKLDRVLDDNYPRDKYRRRECELKSANHWGQRKLLMSEIEFLLQFADQTPNVLYVGAAPGDHSLILMKMFPHMIMHMYDTQPFAMRPNSQFIQFAEYFTDAHAERYAEDGKDWLFICDIRGFRKFNDKYINSAHENESVIAEDMVDQEEWAYTIKPRASLLKFRLGWDDKMSRYMDGKILIQIWHGLTSTEMRLLSERQPDGKMPPRRQYSNKLYEDQCYKHNIEIRVGIHKPFETKEIKLTADTISPTATGGKPKSATTATTSSRKGTAPDDSNYFGPYFCSCYDCCTEIELLAKYLDSPYGSRVVQNLTRQPGEPLVESAEFIAALSDNTPKDPALVTNFVKALTATPDWSDLSYAILVSFIYEEITSYEPAAFLLALAAIVKRASPTKKTDQILALITPPASPPAEELKALFSHLTAVAAQVRVAPQTRTPEVAAIDFKSANPQSREVILKFAARISYFLNLHATGSSRRLNAVEFGDSEMPKFTQPMIVQNYII